MQQVGRWVSISLLLIIGLVTAVAADVREQLAAIEMKVKEEKQHLREIEGKRLRLALAIKSQKKAIKSIEDRRDRVASDINSLQLRQHTLGLEREQTNAEIVTIRELAGQRLKGVYLSHRATLSSQLLSLLSQSNDTDATRAMFFLAKLRKADEALINRISLLIEQADSQLRELESIQLERQDLEQQLEYQSEALRLSIDAEAQMLTELDLERQSTKSSLKVLRAEAVRLERIVFTMTGGEFNEGRAVVSPRGLKFGGESPAQPKSVVGIVLTPVNGSVVQLFGKRKVAGFDDFVFSKGIEFAVPGGGDVKAVLDGTVRFSGSMPGYDLVMILDHGDRNYSLYGRLLQANVQVGQQVTKGDVIAKVGTGSDGGKNFYFEFRRSGLPQDPLPLFAERPQINVSS